MKPRHSTATALVLFVAAMVAWFVVRSHVSPPDAALVPRTPVADSPVPSQSPHRVPSSPTGIAAAVPSVSASPVATPVSTATPLFSVSPPASAAPTLVVADPAAARLDAASINAIRVRRMVTDYHTLGGENPVGTNAEIMAAIMGKNQRQAILGPPEGLNLNGNGELVDDWGTPYFFHQLSKDVMEIHSAGPDKIMGTADDIVVR